MRAIQVVGFGAPLFLDEVAELTPAAQVKRMRVLQERQYERVGGTATLTVDARLVAATNRDLIHVLTMYIHLTRSRQPRTTSEGT